MRLIRHTKSMKTYAPMKLSLCVSNRARGAYLNPSKLKQNLPSHNLAIEWDLLKCSVRCSPVMIHTYHKFCMVHRFFSLLFAKFYFSVDITVNSVLFKECCMH